MRKAGVTDYEAFARSVLAKITTFRFPSKSFADDFDMMERQARVIATWGPNVNVKIPVMNTEVFLRPCHQQSLGATTFHSM